MDAMMLDQIRVTPLARIPTRGGDVMHAMKQVDAGYSGFGEAYFSWIEKGVVKAWKRHTRMTMNVVIPLGSVRFVFIAERGGAVRQEIAGEDRYVRLTVPPGIWFGFQGLHDPRSLLLNVANIPHDATEVERRDLSEMSFDWRHE